MSQRISFDSPRDRAWSSKQGTLEVVEPHRQGRVSMTVQDGHGPVWQVDAHVCEQPGSGFAHSEMHVGTRSVHADRVRMVPTGKKSADDESSVRLPQGHVCTAAGERGQGAGNGEGT